MEVDAVYSDKGKRGKGSNGMEGKDTGKGKQKGKQERSPKFEGYCGDCGKLDHKHKDCRNKNTLTEVNKKKSAEPPCHDTPDIPK